MERIGQIVFMSFKIPAIVVLFVGIAMAVMVGLTPYISPTPDTTYVTTWVAGFLVLMVFIPIAFGIWLLGALAKLILMCWD